MIKFSIITPLYNCKDYILETIKSVERQTYPHFELIIVDDHSTDNSFEIAANYLERTDIQYHLVRRPENLPKGVASCRNHAINISMGEWVCFLDSDDLFHLNKLETLLSLIETKEASAIHHLVKLIDSEGKEINRKFIAPVRIKFKELLKGNAIVTSSVCISKKLFNSIGFFDINLHGVEDYLMWLKVSKQTSWEYLDISLTSYRVRDNSLMRARNLTYYVNENYKLLQNYRQEIDFSPEELSIFQANLFFNTMRYYVSISLSKYGYLDFLKGMVQLIKLGKIRSAAHFLYKVHKHKLFISLSKLKYI
jgi:teichuronic acid biosynthesis glycosyltransferase TuaG